MSNSISCITGIGTVNPLGANIEEFFSNLFVGKSGLTDVRNIEIDTGNLSYVGCISKDFTKILNKRVVKQSDRFIHLALVATKEAIENRSSKIEYAPLKKGIFFGNNSGGWDICEKGFFEFFTKSPKLVNPYQATAWFPTAPQGFTSIVYNFKGYSKSFVADRLSCAQSLYFANKNIKKGKNDLIVCGGVEAPITTFGLQCYYGVGNLSELKDREKVYLPFSNTKDNGLVLGEGSSILTLENSENTEKKDIYAYLKDVKYIDISEKNELLAYSLENILVNNNLDPDDIDLILPEGSSINKEDKIEVAALNRVFSKKVPIAITKHYFGHLFGASTATDIIIAILAMKKNQLPPYITLKETFSNYEIKYKEKKAINNVITISISKDKECIITLLKKGDKCND